jgi:uncharacterized DUF497 family protein
MDKLTACTGFEWDEGNAEKNWIGHLVSRSECEQVFFNWPFVVKSPGMQTVREPRYCALGRTDAGRRLFVVFAVRGKLIRVISARDMSRRERKAYAREQEETKDDSEV